MAEDDIPTARRSGIARIARWIAIAAAGLLLLAAAIGFGINTGPGHVILARQLAAYETASGITIHVRRIEGSIYGRMTLVGFEVHDSNGAFLTSPALTVDWRPLAYTRGKIDVRELASAQVRLLRLPALKPTPTDPDAPILPDIDLAVGKLAIAQFVIEKPVTGKRHVVGLAGTADIADRRARVGLDAAAIAGPGLAGGDRLALKLDATPDANRLLIDAKLVAPAGGLVDSYAGFGKPLTMTVFGRGDWASWTGRADALLAGQPLAKLAVTARDGAFAVKGPLRPGLFLGGPAARMTEPAIDLDLAAALSRRKVDLRVAARSNAFSAQAQGVFDLAESRLGNVRIDAALLTPGAIAPNLSGRDVRLAAVLDGPMATPTIDYRATATRIAFGAMGVDGLIAAGRATIDADRILVPLHATARRVSGLNAATGGLLTNLAIDGDLAYAKGRLLSDNLKLRSDRIDATAIVLADPAKGTYTGALKGRINDYQVDGLGRINLATDAKLVTGPKGGFGITGWVRANTRRLDNASVRDFLGGNALVTANVGFDEDGVASVRNLRVSAPRFRLADGSGSYRTSDGRIAFQARAQSAQYGPLTVTASGTAARPLVKLGAAHPNVGVQLDNVEAMLEGIAQGYRVQARGGSPYGPFAADLVVRAGRGPLALDIRTARFAGVDFGGSIVQTATGPFSGALAVAGSGFRGNVRLAAAGKYQRADVDLRASAARIPGAMPITIGRGLIRGSAILYPAGPAIDGDAVLGDVRQGAFLLTRAQARIRYRDGRGTVALTAGGRSGAPFDVAMQAALASDRVVANARGTVNGIAFRLAAPAVATKQTGEWRLAPAEIVLPQGQIALSGRYGGTTQAHAVVRNLDLAIVQAAVPGLGLGGKASGTVDFALPAGNGRPRLTARLDIARFTRTAAYVVSQPVDIATLATLSDSGGELRALIRRGGGVVGRMQARLAPIPAGGAGWTARLLAAPLSGGIRYDGPAEVLWTLTGIAGQQLSGPVAVAADFGGRLDQPTLTGVVRANALRYENDIYGTVISRIAINGRFSQSDLRIVSFSGRAGDGTISGRGAVGFAAASGFPIDVAVTLDKARLARSDALGATVSGTLAITNSKAGGALIKGDLRLPEARYEIIRQGAAEVPELTGVRRKNAAPQPSGASEIPSKWKLDIRLRADNRIFVSGMGLEAEWQTDMRIGGTASNPVVVGKLEIVRGTYSFAGRRFELASDGAITFDGGPLTNPELSLSASTTVNGVSAIINIGGRAQTPQISFTSTPTLPQDEVLSRLLFGTSVTTLSPTQAIQLAAALNSLRGSGGGLNPLGKLRSASGVDRLRVLGADKTAGRGTALAAGKYISNNIYVEVVTDARGFTATQLEISLSKALSLLSQAGSFGGSSVNLRYSKDY